MRISFINFECPICGGPVKAKVFVDQKEEQDGEITVEISTESIERLMRRHRCPKAKPRKARGQSRPFEICRPPYITDED